MVQICCVCYNTRKNNKNVSFHLFPKDVSKRTMWLNALNLTSISNWKKICSAHFSASDFIFSNSRNILRSTAVPTSNSILMEEHSYADNVATSSPCLIIPDVYSSSPSTSMTKSYENVNVETSQSSQFNLCTDVKVIIPPKKTGRIWCSNRIWNLSDEDCRARYSAKDSILSNNRNILPSTAVPTSNSILMEEHSYADNVATSSPCLIIPDVYSSSPSTSMTKSYENVNVETSQSSQFNLCTDVKVIIPPKKTGRIWCSNRIWNLSDEDCRARFSAKDSILSNNRNILPSTTVPTKNSKLMEEHSYAYNAATSSPCLMNPDVYYSSLSTSRIKSPENVNVVETSRPSQFNLSTDVEVITPPKKPRRIWSSSRIGDLIDEDFSSPEKRKNNLCLIKNTVKNIRQKNKILSQRNQRLKKKVSLLLDIINGIKN